MTHHTYGFPCDDFGATNSSGVFRKKFRDKYFYYVTEPGNTIQQPFMDRAWADEINSASQSQMNLVSTADPQEVPPSTQQQAAPPHTQPEPQLNAAEPAPPATPSQQPKTPSQLELNLNPSQAKSNQRSNKRKYHSTYHTPQKEGELDSGKRIRSARLQSIDRFSPSTSPDLRCRKRS